MKNRPQAKDCPDRPILEALRGFAPLWATHYDASESMPSLMTAFPQGMPEKVRQAKMASLIRRGLVHGCACGCRGDFQITDKGLEALRS